MFHFLTEKANILQMFWQWQFKKKFEENKRQKGGQVCFLESRGDPLWLDPGTEQMSSVCTTPCRPREGRTEGLPARAVS